MQRSFTLCTMLVLALALSPVYARTWTDASGKFKVEADLIAQNTEGIVVKTQKGKLLVLEIKQLSQDDQKYLKSAEAGTDRLADTDKNHTWSLTIKDLKVTGSLTGYYAEDYVIQRAQSKVVVNGKKENELPELFLRVLPAIVNHFERTDLADLRALNNWLTKEGKGEHKYHVEGVHMQLASGVNVKIPIFLFGSVEQEFLKPGLERWVAMQSEKMEYEQKAELERREAMMMAASARAYQANQAAQTQAQIMQLELLAVATGATELWEVALLPTMAYGRPFTVIVPARNSLAAEQQALQRYPGTRVGATRKFAGY